MMRNALISAGKIALYFLLLGLIVVVAMEYGLPGLGVKLAAGSQVPPVVILGVVNLLAMSIPAVLLALILDAKSPAAMGLVTQGSLVDFATGSMVGGFIFLCALAAAFFGGWAMLNPDFSKLSLCAMALGAFGVALASAGEEVMMRGYIMQELMSKFSTPAAVVVSSLIFVGLHAGA